MNEFTSEAPQPRPVRDPASPNTDLVRAYLSQIARTALLTAEQEVELSKTIEAGLYAETILDEVNADYSETDENILAEAAPSKAAESDRTATITHAIAAQVANVREDRQLRREYAVLAAEGQRAKNHMLEANLRLVVSIAKRYTGKGMDFIDIIQEGNTGLIRAVEKFDYSKGYKFSTYATWWIKQSINRGMADKSRDIRIPVHQYEKLKKMLTHRINCMRHLNASRRMMSWRHRQITRSRTLITYGKSVGTLSVLISRSAGILAICVTNQASEILSKI